MYVPGLANCYFKGKIRFKGSFFFVSYSSLFLSKQFPFGEPTSQVHHRKV